VPQLTQCLHLEELLREVVSQCDILKMAASGCQASERTKTWVTFDAWWTFMWFIKQSDQLPKF